VRHAPAAPAAARDRRRGAADAEAYYSDVMVGAVAQLRRDGGAVAQRPVVTLTAAFPQLFAAH